MAEYKEHKIDGKLIHSPVEGLCGNPKEVAPAGGVYDGEPGYPKRSAGHGGPKSKTLDTIGTFGKEPAEG